MAEEALGYKRVRFAHERGAAIGEYPDLSNPRSFVLDQHGRSH
jgi:hypothetical protein